MFSTNAINFKMIDNNDSNDDCNELMNYGNCFLFTRTKSVLLVQNANRIQKNYSSLAYLDMSNQDQNN